MNIKLAAAIATLGILAAAPAMAATSSLVAPCTLLVGGHCLFNGNINTQLTGNNSLGDADIAYNTQSPVPNPLLNLAGMTNIVDVQSGFGASQTTGSINSAFLVSYYAVKAGNYFDLFKIAPSTSFNWTTGNISVGRGNTPAISHLIYFGSSVAVPEPASWALMILGFGGVGAALRARHRVLAAI